MLDGLITDEALVELTGLQRPFAQMRWLRENGVPFHVRRDGKPRTTWAAIQESLVRKSSSGPRLDRIR